MFELRIKRIYDAAESDDGWRVLVDRLWPRGISKERAAIDRWAKEVAPSDEVRKQFGHDEEKFPAFAVAYKKELAVNEAAQEFVARCTAELKSRNVTLLYAAKDELHNNAVVLREWEERRSERNGKRQRARGERGEN